MPLPILFLYEKVKNLIKSSQIKKKDALEPVEKTIHRNIALNTPEKIFSYKEWEEEVGKLYEDIVGEKMDRMTCTCYSNILYIIFTGKIDIDASITESDIDNVIQYLRYCNRKFGKRR